MSILGILDIFDMQASGRQYLEAGKQAQWQSMAEHLLLQAGPGHQVVGVTWRDRNGWERGERKVFKVDASKEEIDTWKRTTDWPGHAGGWWNYFKDDVRAKLRKEQGE